MTKQQKQLWFVSCLQNYNRRKEEELIHKWSQLTVKIGGVLLMSIAVIKLASGI